MNAARRTNPVKIKVNAYGAGEIEIGGRKLGNYTTGFQIVQRVGDVPNIIVSFIATEGLEIELDALVDVVIRDPRKEAQEVERHEQLTAAKSMMGKS